MKRLLKKYPSLRQEMDGLLDSLELNPTQGTSLGRNCYKIRLRIASKGRGKSGGARVITCVVAVSTEVYLLAVYDKSEQDSITDADLLALVQEIPTGQS
ncbi:type II toxin-antitoxin system RelE/ParE family toxin [Hymenobacter baengnokdamensis]|uniref:type II toxin-antitoxin system RelE/ParE family toxin n=1 Tax=Hymenobacter baengnokdamensis TaxID=2615203 RepID=UPI001E2D59B6|nr:type II toxin-antitoxin system RelE/ParE family toxin [Hymenobacter baengnokdamensis]